MQEIFNSLDLSQTFETTGEGVLPSCYPVTGLATHAFGAVGCALSSVMESLDLAKTLPVTVDQRLASLWFGYSIYPTGWELPPIWDAVAGDYQTKDGWIKLHTNLPHHRAAACRVLGTPPERDTVAAAVATWDKDTLEEAITSEGGVAAAMRSRSEWQQHAQGRAISEEPLIHWGPARQLKPKVWQPSPERPLDGLRVLDLTRVLAGPVATRTLAGYGADVLRIDPPEWDEPNVVPDITTGKRCARLDVRKEHDRRIFETLLRNADILVHGYRPGALDNLGFSEDWRRSIAPELIEVSLCAYGWTGPWRTRRGFDSLVQMSTGINHTGMARAGDNKPKPLPVQALDHATGYLMAAAVIRALDANIRGEPVANARLSLARTAELLIDEGSGPDETEIGAAGDTDLSEYTEHTPWGPARRLRPAVAVGETQMAWRTPACALGSASPEWL